LRNDERREKGEGRREREGEEKEKEQQIARTFLILEPQLVKV
jgi:hypothetical protein